MKKAITLSMKELSHLTDWMSDQADIDNPGDRKALKTLKKLLQIIPFKVIRKYIK